jgi:homoserine dehydrogenase
VTSVSPLRVGIAGLGTVGAGLIAMIQGHGPLSRAVTIAGVCASSRSRPRPVDISAYRWFDDAAALASDPDVDVLVELVGGSDGPAKHAVETALKAGKSVVTANKALLAEHGVALAALASGHGAELRYEAAIAGGIPVVKALREGLAANHIEAVCGVLNGTCNYILTEMDQTGRPFGDVLADAQKLGYAEADPTLDVSGADAGHKLSLLAALAFSGRPDFGSMLLEGITQIEPIDLQTAAFLGFRIKLLAMAKRDGNTVMQSVRPTLLKTDHPIARIDGPLNAVVIDADPVGRISLVGRGAGAGPTASAVAGDLMDLSHGDSRPVFAGPGSGGQAMGAGRADTMTSRFYLRLRVSDQPGMIARVTETLARHGVSIESFLQKPPEDAARVPIALTTQPIPEPALRAAVADLMTLAVVVEPPLLMPIEL